MNKYITVLLVSGLVLSTPGFGTEPAETEAVSVQEEIQFTPPLNWRFTEKDKLPGSVKLMVVGKGEHEFPPSMNLGSEPFDGTLKDYLRTIKSINEARHAEYKDLGTIRTDAGNANLSQVDMHTEWGDVRMMHVILMHDGVAYILTAAALKDEFPTYYKDFFKSMTSLKITQKAQPQLTMETPSTHS